MFEKLFKRKKTIKKFLNAPLLNERLVYLEYISNNGAKSKTLKEISYGLLILVKYLNLKKKRMVNLHEIKAASRRYAKQLRRDSCKYNYSKQAESIFVYRATQWLSRIGCLKIPDVIIKPSTKYISQYLDYMRNEQGLSEANIKIKCFHLKKFFSHIDRKKVALDQLTPAIIDKILIKKHKVDKYSRISIRSFASALRSFLRYAEKSNWCQCNLSQSINAPRVYRYDALPSAPSWTNVKKILKNSEGNHPKNIRDKAILLLLSVYGLRCSEVIKLRLEDIDWKKEIFILRRSKNSKLQQFPLSKTVGDAILRYLKTVRPHNCSQREIFICLRAPFRPLGSPAVFMLVKKRLMSLNVALKHYGPHSLRHACATHLINEGHSIKEISDYLGHSGLEATLIYTKVDLTSLRKVANFDIGDLL